MLTYTIKQARRLAELSQDEMSRAMGYKTRDAYRRIEQDPNKATIAQLRKIAQITKIPLNMLTCDVEPKS